MKPKPLFTYNFCFASSYRPAHCLYTYCTGLHFKPGTSIPNCIPCVCPLTVRSTSGNLGFTCASQWLGSWLIKILKEYFSVPAYALAISPYLGNRAFALQFSIPNNAICSLFFSNTT